MKSLEEILNPWLDPEPGVYPITYCSLTIDDLTSLEDVEALADAIAKNTFVTSLNLNMIDVSKVSPAHFRALLAGIKSNKHIKSLTIGFDWSRLSDEHYKAWLALLGDKANFNELNLGWSFGTLSPERHIALQEVMRNKPSVKVVLYISEGYCKQPFMKCLEYDLAHKLHLYIPDKILNNAEQLIEVAKQVAHMPWLEELTIQCDFSKVPEKTLVTFVEILASSGTLQIVNMPQCNLLSFDLKTLETISKALRALPCYQSCQLFPTTASDVPSEINDNLEKKAFYIREVLVGHAEQGYQVSTFPVKIPVELAITILNEHLVRFPEKGGESSRCSGGEFRAMGGRHS